MANEVYRKLAAVQSLLHAPKDKKNSFQGYKYRSAEDILERVKPLLKEENALIVLSDDVVALGPDHTTYTCIDPKSGLFGKEVTDAQHFYLRATAKFIDIDSGESVSVTAMAREEEVSKGTEEPKLTGKASSYARKYALNGLLAIDDADQDPDKTSRNDAPGASNGSGSARTTSPAPAAPAAHTKPQATKTQKSAKAKEAWKEFNTLASVKSMDDTAKSKFFFTTLKSALGKDDPAKVTDAEWQKFIEHIDFLRTEG